MKKKQLKKLIKRLYSEQKLLNKNISKLDIFLRKYMNKEVTVSDFQYSMLRQQQLVMLDYDAILRQRLEDFEVKLEQKKEVKEWLS